MIGIEGMVGISALLGGESSTQTSYRADCRHHAPHGRCWSKAAFDQTEAVRDLVLRFADVLG
jgi:hypothetical protein